MSEKRDVTSAEYLKDTFKIGYDAYEDSRLEAKAVWDLYHNRHYTQGQLDILTNRGQPAETFNIVKLFARMLLGYYSTVINTVQVNPVGLEDVPTSALLNDVIAYTMRDNNFIVEGEKIKLGGIISGLMCSYIDVQATGEKDQFGRPKHRLVLEHVPESEIVLDPMSRRDDYKDARYIHRYKWVSEEQIVELFGEKVEEKLEAHYNFTQQQDAEFDANGKKQEVGLYRIHDSYLIVHSIVKDSKGKTWEVYWNDDVILKKTEITHREVAFPYRVVKTNPSETNEYYGIFREVIETQKAINQALIKLQLLVNTQKAFVQDGAVENLADFTDAFNRVTAVIPVQDLNGIKIESLSREAMEQYQIIDKAFDRVQRILGINDSFLGQAFASDSGRKVKLQKDASIMSLRYLTGRLEAFYRFLGWDMANLIKQYYTAHEVVRIADDATGQRWVELNKPMQTFTGEMNQQTGEPIMQTEYEEVLDPGSQEPMIDDDGNFIIAPIPTEESELAYTKIDIEINSVSYNDEDEKNQLLIEGVLSGTVGQLLSQVNPAGYFKAASLSMKSVKTKNSPEIAAIMEQTSQMLSQTPGAEQDAADKAGGLPGQGGGPSSRTLNVPAGG
jgi:hypothetical protein